MGSSQSNTSVGLIHREVMESTMAEVMPDIGRPPFTAVVLGCGQRGRGYATFALDFPQHLKIVGAADPLPACLDKMERDYGLSQDQLFSDWREVAALKERLADIAMVCTQDRMHFEAAAAMARKGYHLILEKPMSNDEAECEQMVDVVRDSGVSAVVCHVLRYFPPCTKIKEVIDSGALGEVTTIDHRENILYWHFAHSFVRGNWRREDQSSFSLLAKSCHDLDLINYWMGGDRCVSIQSFGSLQHFRPEKTPTAAMGDKVKTCFDCPVQKACPYSAEKIYIDPARRGHIQWPVSVVCDLEDLAKKDKDPLKELKDALESGPYGRCVYKCDNDVVDHQVVNMRYQSGATVAFTMNAFTADIRRETRICGSQGELRWDGSAQNLVLHHFTTGLREEIKMDGLLPVGIKNVGHGGADFYLVKNFILALARGKHEDLTKGLNSALESHKLVFAAEKSRRSNGQTLELNVSS